MYVFTYAFYPQQLPGVKIWKLLQWQMQVHSQCYSGHQRSESRRCSENINGGIVWNKRWIYRLHCYVRTFWSSQWKIYYHMSSFIPRLKMFRGIYTQNTILPMPIFGGTTVPGETRLDRPTGSGYLDWDIAMFLESCARMRTLLGNVIEEHGKYNRTTSYSSSLWNSSQIAPLRKNDAGTVRSPSNVQFYAYSGFSPVQNAKKTPIWLYIFMIQWLVKWVVTLWIMAINLERAFHKQG